MIKRIIALALALLILSASLVLTSYADEPVSDTLSIEDGWHTNDTSIELKRISEADRKDVYSFEISKYYQPGWRGLMQNFEVPLDLFYYSEISFDCYVGALEPEDMSYHVRAVFWSENDQEEYRVDIEAGIWQGVVFDISSLTFKEEIIGIEISASATCEGEEITLEKISFDNISIGKMKDKKMLDAYMSESFSVFGGELDLNSKDRMTLTVNASNPTITSDVYARGITEKNAARFVIENRTDATKLTLLYSETANFQNARRVSLDAKEGYGVYVFEFGEGVCPTRLRLLFEGAGSGEADILSASMVYLYPEETANRGAVDICRIDEGSGALEVKGTVGYNTAVSYSDCRLALYKLDIWEDESSIKDKAPIATTAMSSRFEFYVELSSLPLATEKYAVAVCTKNGERVEFLIDSAKYITNLGVLSGTAEKKYSDSIKGLATDDVNTAKKLGATHAVIDVSLDRITTEKGTGYLHTAKGSYYYYDLDEVKRLDETVRLYTSAGVAVYIRLLLSDTEGADSVLFADSESAGRTEAIVDFLSSRYNGSDKGRIVGFVIGSKVDITGDYLAERGMSQRDYMEELARAVRLVDSAAKMNDASIKTVLSLSDSFRYERYTEDMLCGREYDKELLLLGLSRAISSGGMLDWSIMWENDGFFYAPDSTERVSASNIYLLLETLEENSKKYDGAPDGMIYYYTPSADDMKNFEAIYAYSYYTFIFEDAVRAFITSVELDTLSERFTELIRYIDTAHSASYTDGLYSYFGAQGWSELIAGNTAAKPPYTALFETELAYERPADVTGELLLWNFADAYSSLGWQKGMACTRLAVGKSFDEIGLCAALDGAGSIVYAYDTPQSAELYSHLSFELMAPAETDGVEIKLTVGGSNFRIESKGKISANAKNTVYVDLSGIPIGAGIEYIELESASEELMLYRANAYSKRYTDAELLALTSQPSEAEQKEYDPIWIVIVATALIGTVAAAIMISKNEKDGEA